LDSGSELAKTPQMGLIKDLPAWQRWGDGELAYSPRRGRHAIKVALASTLALVFAVRYNWPHPSWVLMMILPGMLPVLGAAIQTIMGRLAAVLLGGIFSLLVVATFIQEPLLLSVVIGLLIFGVIYGVTGPVGPAVAKLADAELNLSYTKVTAVQDAFISGLNLPPGNYVSVGEPLFTLVTNTTWRITGNFLETDLARIKPGQKAVIRLQTYPDHRLKGVVEGISWGIEQQAGDVERGGLPDVTPTVDWVRLAQRFPVSVKFVNVSPEVKLRVGMNGNLQIDTTAASR